MTITKEIINQIAQNFVAGEADHAPITEVATIYQGITSDEAYQVQAAVVAETIRRGHKPVGKKAGATSPGAQKTLQVTEPLQGTLFEHYRVAYGQPVSTKHLIRPLLECEVIFIMDKDISGPNVTAADVLSATKAVAAGFEIVDFRTNDFQIGMGEAICYNVFASGFVVGPNQVSPDTVDLPGFKLSLTKNGETVAEATGAAVLGDPAVAMAWLVNKLAEGGDGLSAGDVVLSGAIAAPHPIAAGDKFEAAFEGLGTISVRFS